MIYTYNQFKYKNQKETFLFKSQPTLYEWLLDNKIIPQNTLPENVHDILKVSKNNISLFFNNDYLKNKSESSYDYKKDVQFIYQAILEYPNYDIVNNTPEHLKRIIRSITLNEEREIVFNLFPDDLLFFYNIISNKYFTYIHSKYNVDYLNDNVCF